MNKIMLEIDNCCKCPHSYQEKVYTPDSFETEIGCYCSKIVDKNSYNKRNKIVVADEDVEQWANIPDWCPLLLKNKGRRIEELEQRVMAYDDILKKLN